MNVIEKLQFKERISGTLLRLSRLVALAVFTPALSYVTYGAIEIGRFLYLAALILIVLATMFLILLSEGFRETFNAEAADVLPLVQKVYASFEVLIFILFAVGLVLAALTILLALKENNGRASRNKIVSSCVVSVMLLIGVIIYAATKSKIMGEAV